MTMCLRLRPPNTPHFPTRFPLPFSSPKHPKPAARSLRRQGSALRVSFLKLKEGLGEEAKSEVLATVKGVVDGLGQIRQLSVGENYSPARAKGFSIASLAVFDGPGDLEALESSEEFMNSQKDKVRDYLESAIAVDYVRLAHPLSVLSGDTVRKTVDDEHTEDLTRRWTDPEVLED